MPQRRTHRDVTPPEPTCFGCQARERAGWCVLSPEELTLLDQAKSRRSYRHDQVIFRQGDPVEGIYCIEAGTVAVRKSGARGGEAITRIHQDGETVGYPDHFSDGTHTGTAQALTDSRLCFIGREALSELLERNPALGLRFLGRLAGDLQQTEETLIAERTLPVRARLAHALLVLKDRFDTVDESGAITLELPFSRQDLACLIGARPESLSRAIRELEEAGVARFQGRTVILPDLDTLLDELERSGEPQA